MSGLRTASPALPVNPAKPGDNTADTERGKVRRPDLLKLGAGGFWSQRAKWLSSQGQVGSNDSADHRPWLPALSRQVWPPTVVAETLQVAALAYILTGLFCVSVQSRDGYFPLDTVIGFLVRLCPFFCHIKDPPFLQWSLRALVWLSKAHMLKVWSLAWHSGEAVIPLGRGGAHGSLLALR